MSHDIFLKIPKFCLVLGGFWPFKISDNPLYVAIYRVYNRFQTISYVCFIASLLINLILLTLRHDQPTRIFASINVFIIVMETCIKLLLFQIEKIPDMFAHTMRNEEMIFSSDDYEIKAEYFRQAKYCRKVNILQCGSTTFSCVTFAAVALIQLFKADDMSIYKKQPFMHDIWYPFLSIENHMGVVVFTNLFVVCQGACFNSATQCTFIGLMIYSSMRFRLLHIKIKKFGLTPQENPLALLEELIVEHQDLLQFVKTLNERTKYVMLLEFLLNAVSLASGLLQLVMIKTITQLFSICAIILLQLIQIFVLAWSANEISVASLSIADAVATSNWIGQALMVKKLLLIVLMRAQVPVGLTAGPFFNMSTVTAVNTLKAAYTYVSFMMRNLQN